MSKIKEFLKNTYLDFFLNKNHKKSKDTHIVFLCQCEYVWDKTRPVFIELVNRGVKCSLYVVKDKLSVSKESETIFEKEFGEHCYKHEDIALKKLKPSMVIYTRPYDNYLPRSLKSTVVMTYTKIGYIPYYFTLEEEYGLNDSFFKRASLYFASQSEDKEYFDEYCKRNVQRGLQKSFNIGYPSLEEISKKEHRNPKHDSFNLMWTPRWALEPSLGGSNFLNYYQKMFDEVLNNQEYKLVFRPHPMMFNNLLNKNALSQEEYQTIIKRLDEANNAYLDTSSLYFDKFEESDVLITDYSAIIIEYFLLGKPLIFCNTETNLVYDKLLLKIQEVNYVANSFEDVKKYLDLLKSGKDDKKEARLKLLDEIIRSNQNASKNIVDTILENN